MIMFPYFVMWLDTELLFDCLETKCKREREAPDCKERQVKQTSKQIKKSLYKYKL